MATRNVFEIMQAELHPQNDSNDDEESSEDESVPPESSDSEDDAVEEDLRERTDEEEIDNSNEDMSAHVTSLIDLTGKDGTVWQSTPPPRTTNSTTSFGHRPNQQIYRVYKLMLYKLFDCTYVIKYSTSLSLTKTWKLKKFTTKSTVTANGNQQTELKFWPT